MEELELRNVPIPEDAEVADSAHPVARADEPSPVSSMIASFWRPLERRLMAELSMSIKKFIFPLFGLMRFDPFRLLAWLGYDQLPEYESPDTEEWRLMAALLRRFANGAAPSPFVIVPIVSSTYMRFAMGRNYWLRFSSLADGERVHVIDVLPQFLKLGRRAAACYMEPRDNHLSELGHLVLADAVEAELRARGLLPIRNPATRAAD